MVRERKDKQNVITFIEQQMITLVTVQYTEIKESD